MKKTQLLATMLLALALTACASSSSQTAIPTIFLDDGGSPSANQPGDAGAVTASGLVVPLKEARLSFSAVGRVTSVDVKVGDKVAAGQVLVHLDTTLLEARVREAEANLTVAQVQVDYLKRVGTDELHLETAQAEADRAQALLNSAKTTLLVQSALTAPFDGTIASVDISPAETVVPGQVIVVLGDLTEYQIETTDLSERDVPKVQIDQSANIFIEALAREVSGKVVEVARLSSTLGGDVVYKVTIRLDEQTQGLLWGMSADVKIQTGE